MTSALKKEEESGCIEESKTAEGPSKTIRMLAKY